MSVRAESALTAESPFLPTGGASVATASTENITLEYRGMTQIGTEPMFCLVNTSSPQKKGIWVKLNEPGHEFTVKSYEIKDDTVTVSVDYQGRLLQLELAKPKVGAGSVAMTGVRPNMAPPMRGPPGAPASLNPTPADEATRLANVAQEVLRRRQMRQQAAAQQKTAPQPNRNR